MAGYYSESRSPTPRNRGRRGRDRGGRRCGVARESCDFVEQPKMLHADPCMLVPCAYREFSMNLVLVRPPSIVYSPTYLIRSSAGAVTAAGLGVAGTAATTSEAEREGPVVYFVRATTCLQAAVVRGALLATARGNWSRAGSFQGCGYVLRTSSF